MGPAVVHLRVIRKTELPYLICIETHRLDRLPRRIKGLVVAEL